MDRIDFPGLLKGRDGCGNLQRLLQAIEKLHPGFGGGAAV
jgi:hypothetical protein